MFDIRTEIHVVLPHWSRLLCCNWCKHYNIQMVHLAESLHTERRRPSLALHVLQAGGCFHSVSFPPFLQKHNKFPYDYPIMCFLHWHVCHWRLLLRGITEEWRSFRMLSSYSTYQCPFFWRWQELCASSFLALFIMLDQEYWSAGHSDRWWSSSLLPHNKETPFIWSPILMRYPVSAKLRVWKYLSNFIPLKTDSIPFSIQDLN